MKRTIPAVLIAAALALAGCSSTSTGQAGTAAGAALPTATATVAPIIQDTAPAPSPTALDEEAEYLRSLKSVWRGNVPSDADLIAAGRFACQEFEAGKSRDDIVAVQGGSADAEANNRHVVTSAAQLFCPAYFG